MSGGNRQYRKRHACRVHNEPISFFTGEFSWTGEARVIGDEHRILHPRLAPTDQCKIKCRGEAGGRNMHRFINLFPPASPVNG